MLARDLVAAGHPFVVIDSNEARVREAYAERLAAQQEGLAAICSAAGWGFAVHRADHPPEAALLALYLALMPEPGRR